MLEQVGAAPQMLRERLAVVLGQHAGRAPVDELVQVGGVALDGVRGRAQLRAAVGHQPEQPPAHRVQLIGVFPSSSHRWEITYFLPPVQPGLLM